VIGNRRILLGVSGGVAAYKAAYLARRLVERGADIRAVMTLAAEEFLGGQTLAAITGHPVMKSLFGATSVSPHTDLGRWAELVVVAPATADLLAKLANGHADDLLSATLLATKAPVLLAPAMHTEMWEQPSTRRNIARLAADGHHLVGPVGGALAGGDEGLGRMAEPDEILTEIESLLAQPLAGWRVLVTAGGTREAIDPVRFIGNRSSGKMGHAVAVEAARRGAEVTLVTTVPPPDGFGLDVQMVESADEMAAAVASIPTDVAVMVAAVADFRPARAAERKLSRENGPPEMELERTPDILSAVAARRPRPFLVGFAAETGDLSRAADKAAQKGVDLLVANDVTEPGSGFTTETNRVTIVFPAGRTEPWPLLTKVEVARRLWDLIMKQRGESGSV